MIALSSVVWLSVSDGQVGVSDTMPVTLLWFPLPRMLHPGIHHHYTRRVSRLEVSASSLQGILHSGNHPGNQHHQTRPWSLLSCTHGPVLA